ncbi:phospholipid-binding protein [Pseudomonas daroniae]|uniref:Phospholipid-binding protein n=1 Tax=Phytopseudomonas daroniae TaxID=2487519 RepID=A0A4Q9QRF2_9GAMM|nr:MULTISPECIES: BON domain-containing protein [Pseudomonas]TBU78534.1 phospholipid-binding protein [Pseudomonas daroniae]TBU82802.1 phospholipid-binding protein [Pseudomonas daroniae]TBU85998.1 phospholipid-binding protein [Pseudomonas sp. FRB 228]TBU95161.1 phospholipid-binding protein [Pseudomonas daroniae]
MTRSPLIFAVLAMSLILGGCGSRSIGNKIDDQFVGPDVANAISRAHTDLASPTSRIVVTSYNGVILLAGQTPREDLKGIAEQTARKVQGVRKVHNELQVQQPNSLLARSNDSLLTTKIKTQMLADSGVPGSRIKVVTENGIVYLLGVVSRQEANAASNVVQSVSGVQKIIKLFQYTD